MQVNYIRVLARNVETPGQTQSAEIRRSHYNALMFFVQFPNTISIEEVWERVSGYHSAQFALEIDYQEPNFVITATGGEVDVTVDRIAYMWERDSNSWAFIFSYLLWLPFKLIGMRYPFDSGISAHSRDLLNAIQGIVEPPE